MYELNVNFIDEEFHQMKDRITQTKLEQNTKELRNTFHGGRFICDESNNTDNIIDNNEFVVTDKLSGVSITISLEEKESE